ncbi:MAG: ribosome-associated translation inhibitor RaiA [Calditrichaeota bacterium]|nr:MAG: ribosome-associated translation inhibitor RaiA [Calditrichota bacterium]
MRIIFTARHYKAPDDLKKFAEAEVLNLKKYYDGIIDCEIILDYEKQTQVAEIKVSVNGQTLKAIEKSENIRKSITLATNKLERQLKKYKGKWSRKGAVKPSLLEEVEEETVPEEM